MGNRRTQEKINLSASVLSRKLRRLDTLKKTLDKVIAERNNMSENYLSIGNKQKYMKLNDRIAKLNFEIMVMEGGTIKDNHVAEWINKNRWQYQNPYTGEVRDFKVGDRFNLDYGGKVDIERKDWKAPEAGLWGSGGRHGNWIGDPTDSSKFQVFEIERIKDNIENLQIKGSSNRITQLEGESDEMFALRKQTFSDQVYVADGKIVKKSQPGATKMLRSDFFRGTDLDSVQNEHNVLNSSLIESLKIKSSESKRDLSLTNGTK